MCIIGVFMLCVTLALVSDCKKASEELLERVNMLSPAIRRVLYDMLDKPFLVEVLRDETRPLLRTYLEHKINEKRGEE